MDSRLRGNDDCSIDTLITLKIPAMKLPSLNVQILVGAAMGILVGLYFHHLGAENSLVKGGLYTSGLIGTLFIDLLKMILIPLVFCSIAVGIANLRQHSQMHRVWVTTLVFFAFTMAIAITLGMVASNYFKPGTGLQIAMFADAMQNFQTQQLPLPEFFAQFFAWLIYESFCRVGSGKCAGSGDICAYFRCCAGGRW